MGYLRYFLDLSSSAHLMMQVVSQIVIMPVKHVTPGTWMSPHTSAKKNDPALVRLFFSEIGGGRVASSRQKEQVAIHRMTYCVRWKNLTFRLKRRRRRRQRSKSFRSVRVREGQGEGERLLGRQQRKATDEDDVKVVNK